MLDEIVCGLVVLFRKAIFFRLLCRHYKKALQFLSSISHKLRCYSTANIRKGSRGLKDLPAHFTHSCLHLPFGTLSGGLPFVPLFQVQELKPQR